MHVCTYINQVRAFNILSSVVHQLQNHCDRTIRTWRIKVSFNEGFSFILRCKVLKKLHNNGGFLFSLLFSAITPVLSSEFLIIFTLLNIFLRPGLLLLFSYSSILLLLLYLSVSYIPYRLLSYRFPR
jgi:hypothetical protein